jgi:hypothetical protein
LESKPAACMDNPAVLPHPKVSKISRKAFTMQIWWNRGIGLYGTG